MFGKKQEITNSVDLSRGVEIKGYTPDPSQHRAFVFEAKGRLVAARVLDTGGADSIQLAAGVAELNPQHPAAQVLGDHVVIVDSATARAAKNPFTRKGVLALIDMVNASIFGYDFETEAVPIGADSATDINKVPDRAYALVHAGKHYGFRAAKSAQSRQNRRIDSSTKKVVSAFQWKEVKDRFGISQVEDAVAGAFSNLPGFGEGADA